MSRQCVRGLGTPGTPLAILRKQPGNRFFFSSGYMFELFVRPGVCAGALREGNWFKTPVIRGSAGRSDWKSDGSSTELPISRRAFSAERLRGGGRSEERAVPFVQFNHV